MDTLYQFADRIIGLGFLVVMIGCMAMFSGGIMLAVWVFLRGLFCRC